MYSVTEKFISLIIINFICKNVCNFLWHEFLSLSPESMKLRLSHWLLQIIHTWENVCWHLYNLLVLKVSLNSAIKKKSLTTWTLFEQENNRLWLLTTMFCVYLRWPLTPIFCICKHWTFTTIFYVHLDWHLTTIFLYL